MVGARDGDRGEESVFRGDEVSVLQEENVLESVDGDSCTSL